MLMRVRNVKIINKELIYLAWLVSHEVVLHEITIGYIIRTS